MSIVWTDEELALGQSGYTRSEISISTNAGDSSVPTFARVGDKIGFLCQEVMYSGNGRANYRTYLDQLQFLKKMDPSLTWEEIRWSPSDTPTIPLPNHVCPTPDPIIIEKEVEKIVYVDKIVEKEVPTYPLALSVTISYEDGNSQSFDIE